MRPLCSSKLLLLVTLISLSPGLGLNDRATAQTYGTPSYSGSWWGNTGWTGGTNNNNYWYGTPVNAQGWTMGITGTSSERGVVVNSVAINSPAARAGMSVGDLIIAVNGVQVGVVGGRVFDLGEQLNRQANSTGQVRLLIQSRQTLQIRPVQVQLTKVQTGLTGTVFASKTNLPSDTILTVQLENASRPYYAVRNGVQTYRVPPYTQGPIAFSINYDPSSVVATDTYRVRAYMTSGGSTIAYSEQPQNVLTQGNPNSVQLVLTSPSVPYASGGAVNSYATNTYASMPTFTGYDGYSQQIIADYQLYLGRNPNSVELAAWQQLPDINARISRLPLELMAGQEYFDRSGNNNLSWMQKVFVAETIRGLASPRTDGGGGDSAVAPSNRQQLGPGYRSPLRPHPSCPI